MNDTTLIEWLAAQERVTLEWDSDGLDAIWNDQEGQCYTYKQHVWPGEFTQSRLNDSELRVAILRRLLNSTSRAIRPGPDREGSA